MTSLGLWIDDSPSRVLKLKYFDELEELGITTIALMINSSRKPWDLIWSGSNIEKACKMAIERDLEVVLTTWPFPRKSAIDSMVRDMDVFLSFGAIGWEIDVEGNWRRKHVKDFSDLSEAGKYLVENMQKLSMVHDVRLELTTFPAHVENSPSAMLAPHMHRLLPQAYSVRHRKKPVEWHHRYGPGGMQAFTLDKTLLIPGVKEGLVKLCVGLAAWDQGWPGKTPQEAMKKAFDEAMKYEPFEVRFWSSKWVLGVRKNDYSARFICPLRNSPV